jgi:2-polyprenyl-3-methyl-5-hydroxy-6-metoxy-1,4-benzoquinol methylase
MAHDLSFHSGERQVATSYSEIRADHRYRYEWADSLIPVGGYGLDLFCGNGYGAWLLSRTRHVLAIDGSAEAVRFAEQNYQTDKVRFSTGYWPFSLPREVFDFVVSLESIEHVADGGGLFEALVDSLKPGGSLLFSTPCAERLPLAQSGNHFHHKHYELEESLQLGNSRGLSLVDWVGQDTYAMAEDMTIRAILEDDAMRLKPQTPGQFVMFHCRKST